MDCRAVRDALLEADLAELRGAGDSTLSRHLAACSACRAAAARILEDQAALLAALQAPAPRREIAWAIGAARAEAGRRSARRRAWQRWVPLAAAAGLGAIIWIARREPQHPSAARVEPISPPGLMVEAPAGRNVAVLETGNPDIVVIWFF